MGRLHPKAQEMILEFIGISKGSIFFFSFFHKQKCVYETISEEQMLMTKMTDPGEGLGLISLHSALYQTTVYFRHKIAK